MEFFVLFKWQDPTTNPLMSIDQLRQQLAIRGFLWVFIFIDVISSNLFYFSLAYFLPVRPFLLVVSNDALLGAFYSFLLTAWEALDALLLYFIVWGIAAVFGTLIFRFGEFSDRSNLNSFYNITRSLISSFVFVMSGENYGDVVYPAVEANPALVTYFIILTLLGSFIVVSLVVSKFQTSFKALHNKERVRNKYFKRTGFICICICTLLCCFGLFCVFFGMK